MKSNNEQKDKLLINLVEPGRIGRTAPTTANQIHSFLPNGKNGLIGFVELDAARERKERNLKNEILQ